MSQEARRAKDFLKRRVKHMARIAAPLFRPADEVSRILTYHSIGHRQHAMNVMPDAFHEQVAWLKAKHPVISLADAALRHNGIALTFDDGFRDNLLHAAPIIAAHGLPATVFMIAGRMGECMGPDTKMDRLLSRDELRALHGMGISIGSHTLTHPRLALLSASEQKREIHESKDILEQVLGAAVTSFAYPFGSSLDYTATTRQLTQEAGFHLAASNRYGWNEENCDPYTLRRIWIDASDDLSTFQDKVEGRLDTLWLLDSAAGIRMRRILNACLRQ